ncbi:head-tail adaptor protein [Tsuneonella suprasediminis]|uniref:head-tail adaptor protein n=1 Tax=Tsuneonella suprasediminis TaxID=2306996 RepID=UPI002F930725
MTAGQKNTRVVFERATVVPDDYGQEIEIWAPIGRAWAAINWGRGDERRQAAIESGSLSATFTVYDNAMTRGLGLKDRLMLEGAAWDITSSVPGKERGDRDITAVRAL